MPKIPTVSIATSNGPVLINKSDFDETKHKLFGSTAIPEKQEPEKTDTTGANGNAPAATTDQTATTAQTPPPAATTAPNDQTPPPVVDHTEYYVAKIGNKFFVTDRESNKIDNPKFNAKGYATQEDASAAITG